MQRVFGQLYLFSGFAVLSLLVAIYASASASNKLHKTQMLYCCLRCVPDIMLKPMLSCFDGFMRLCFDHRRHRPGRNARLLASITGSQDGPSNGGNGHPVRSSSFDASASTGLETRSHSTDLPVRSSSLDTSASMGLETRSQPTNSVPTRMAQSSSTGPETRSQPTNSVTTRMAQSSSQC